MIWSYWCFHWISILSTKQAQIHTFNLIPLLSLLCSSIASMSYVYITQLQLCCFKSQHKYHIIVRIQTATTYNRFNKSSICQCLSWYGQLSSSIQHPAMTTTNNRPVADKWACCHCYDCGSLQAGRLHQAWLDYYFTQNSNICCLLLNFCLRVPPDTRNRYSSCVWH